MPNIDDAYRVDVYRELKESGALLTLSEVSLLVFKDDTIAEYMEPVVRRILDRGTTRGKVTRDNSRVLVKYKAGPTLK